MGIKKLFGKKLKEYRIKMDFTQEELAEKIGISSKSLSQIELGNNFVSAETLEAICTALNISPKNIFDFDEQIETNSIDYINHKLQNNLYLTKKSIKL